MLTKNSILRQETGKTITDEQQRHQAETIFDVFSPLH
jgi:hypothetical protein